MEMDSGDESWEVSSRPPASPSCDDTRPYTTTRGASRDSNTRDEVAMGTAILEEEYLSAAKLEIMGAPLPEGRVLE